MDLKQHTLTFRIDKNLYKQVKIHVATEGTTVREFISSAIIEKFKRETKEQ